jgi:hypothetical protein
MLALIEKADGKDLALGTVLETLSRPSHAVLIVFLSFALCISGGIPPLSTTLSLTLGLVGFLMAIGRDFWIPRSFAAKAIPYKRLCYVIERLVRVCGRLERWFHPRMLFFIENSRMVRIHGSFVMLLGLVAAIPILLPFNNFVAAFPALLLGLSLLERDGVWVIVSYLSAIPFFIYYGALVYLGYAGFERLMGL